MHFEVTAIERQKWRVDGDGNYVSLVNIEESSLAENTQWICVSCGAVAVDKPETV